MDAPRPAGTTDLLDLLRVWILGVLALGLLGTVTELILLEHYEQPLQLVPVGLIAAALAAIAWHLWRRDSASLNTLLVLMGLFVLAGFLGFIAHFAGSTEFQLELNPDMSTWELLEKVMRAKAPPLLAPGMMLQLGLLGIAYVLSDERYRARTLGALGHSQSKE
jgi:uncharacterized membrane protein